MLHSRQVYIFGYSGHSYVVIDAANSMNLIIAGYFDKEMNQSNPYNIEFKGDESKENIKKIVSKDFGFCAVGDNYIRAKIDLYIKKSGVKRINIVHSSSSVSADAVLGESVFVGPSSVINALSKIGDGVILNSGSIIEHECEIGDYSHIAPGAVLTGGVKVGENTLIGANSIVLPGVIIGDNVIVGAGSVITKNIGDGQTFAGNPGKKID